MVGMRYAAVLPDPVNMSVLEQQEEAMTHTSLGSGDEVKALVNSWNGVCLDWSWVLVLALLNVRHHSWVETCSEELRFC